MEVFNDMEPMLRTFWFIAIPTSIIFLIQTILTFTGGDATDVDGASGHDASHQIFSLRNLINFLLGFSWAGISLYSTINNPVLLFIVSLATGGGFVAIFFIVIRQLMKLAEDNSFKLTETLSKTGEVYLTIPPNRTGKGKILISVKGTYHELDAMTEHDKIESNTPIQVVRVENNGIVIVEPL